MQLRAKNALRRSGFTFLELLAVVCIMLLLLSVGAPRLSSSFFGVQAQAVAMRMAASIKHLRERSIVDKSVYRMVFDYAANTYWFERRSPGEQEFSRAPGRFNTVQSVPAQIKMNGTKNEFFFYPDGSVEPGEISLEGQTTQLLKISESLGTVSVAERKN